uniref:Salivary gland protein 6 n=1 Tax=Anopheles atroparvus TaxID=41427 RepID=A0AAG5DY51_ANOAO
MVKLATSRRWMLLAAVLVCSLLADAQEKQKQWIDRDSVYCGHIDCTKLATFKGEKFCSPCDTHHYCECKETREPLPYLQACKGFAACQSTDRRGSCSRTMRDDLCSHIDEAFRYL